MRIHDDHMYHGAALLQIAEHPRFTAINSIEVSGQKSRSAYRINDTTGIFLKYASKPSKNYGEYPFTFTRDHLQELGEVDHQVRDMLIALVCVEAREIACLSLPQLQELVDRRQKAKGSREDQYVVLVTAAKRKRLRVYVNVPGRRKRILGDPLVIKRQLFPDKLFDQEPIIFLTRMCSETDQKMISSSRSSERPRKGRAGMPPRRGR